MNLSSTHAEDTRGLHDATIDARGLNANGSSCSNDDNWGAALDGCRCRRSLAVVRRSPPVFRFVRRSVTMFRQTGQVLMGEVGVNRVELGLIHSLGP